MKNGPIWLLAIAMAITPPSVKADSVAQVSTSKFIADETRDVLDCRVRPVDPDEPCNDCTPGDEFCEPGMERPDAGMGGPGPRTALRPGDIISFRITFTPVPNGRIYGGGGWITEYVPPGTEVVGARIVDRDGNTVVPRRAGPMASGWGPRGDKNWDALGLEEGSIAQVYCDTGIFFSTDPRTAQAPGDALLDVNNGLEMMEEPTGAGQFADLIGAVTPFYAHNAWDLDQVYAFGTGDAHNGGTGATPHRYGSPVAGPDSWYQLEASPGAVATEPMLAGTVGPWQRIRYPGSETCTGSAATEGGVSARVGVPTDAGRDLTIDSPLPRETNAVRYAIGELIVGEDYFAEISLRVLEVPIHPTLGNVNCAEVFGGDASFPEVASGGTGKDNPWRYYLGAPTCTNTDIYFGKTVDRPLALRGDTLTYTLRVINLSPADQTNVVITDVIDEANGARFVSATGDATVGMPAFAGGVLTWPTLPVLAPGEEHEFTVVVEAGDTVTLNQAFYNSDSITNYRAVAFTLTQGIALIHQSKTVEPREVDPGGTVRYTITMRNDGTAPTAPGGELHETLPAGFTVVPGTSALNGAPFADPTAMPPRFVWTGITGPAPDEMVTLAFDVAIPAGTAPGVYTNTFLSAFGANETATFDTARLGVGVRFTDAPVVGSPLRAGDTTVPGTSTEADGTTIRLLVNGIDRGTTTVMGGAWTVADVPRLFAGQRVTAFATAAGEEESDESAPVIVEPLGGSGPGPDGGLDGGRAAGGAGADGGGADGGGGGGGGGCGCRVDPRGEPSASLLWLLLGVVLLCRARRRARIG
jgi:uncharacterized repeat protein (TIGR01451 family)/MYXO-CTERM domain-containing protein